MRSIVEVKKGMNSKNQEDWITFDEINWLIEQVETLESLIERNHLCCNKVMGYYGLGEYSCHVCGKEITD